MSRQESSETRAELKLGKSFNPRVTHVLYYHYRFVINIFVVVAAIMMITFCEKQCEREIYDIKFVCGADSNHNTKGSVDERAGWIYGGRRDKRKCFFL